MLVIIVLVLFTRRIELLSLAAIVSFSSLIHRASKSLMMLKPPGGYANWVTGVRLLLIIIGSFLFANLPKHIILLLMGSAVLLDFIDGLLARKYKQSSFFGHSFDVEVDAFFVLLMCFYYFQFEDIGWWILLPGVLRYIYIAMTSAVVKTNFKEKKRKYSTIIAGIFFVILLTCLISPTKFRSPALLIGAVLITASFGMSFLNYIRFKTDQQTSE